MTATRDAGQEIGARRKRVEDPRLVRGEGAYVDDLRIPGTVEAVFVRSGYGNARIRGVDLGAAQAAPGVVAVWSGEHVKDTPRIPNTVPIEEKHVSPLPPIAHEYVTFVGYPVAVVVGEDRYQANDAAALIDVDYEPLPAVIDPEKALEPDAPILHPSLGTNVAYHLVKENGDVEGTFARAQHRLSLRLVHGRLAQVPMEPRGILASYDREKDFLTVWRSTQSPFGTRSTLATVLGRKPESIRVIAPDVGGGFGAKGSLYPDELTIVLLAMKLGRPVRWVSTRMEDLQFTMQGRDQTNLVDVAFRDDGTIDGLSIKTIYNVGGVLMSPQAAPPLRVRDFATGAYRVSAYRMEAFGVYTNVGPGGPYRGAGRPEAAFIAERTIEEVARELGLDPIEVRRRNFIRPDEFPYTAATGSTYDSGDYELALGRVLELGEYQRLREEQRQARARGEIVGIGIATTIEVSGQGQEFGSVEIEPDGSVVARSGSSSHGQGHLTSFAQVIADRLEVPFERVRVIQSDTAAMPAGFGTGGSRSMVVGGSAVARASDGVKAKAIQVASALLEVSADDLVYAGGGVEVRGAPERRIELSQLARAASEGVGVTPESPGLRDETNFQADGNAIPYAASIAQVRIDRESGRIRLERLIVVDDIGTVVNPTIVYGQMSGGLAQGVGEALYEYLAWDEDGQLLTATLQDYAVPTAEMVPDFEMDMTCTPSPFNPLGAKGVGESGCVSAPPAIVNAVLDALAPLGIRNLNMPLTSEKIWRALREAEGK